MSIIMYLVIFLLIDKIIFNKRKIELILNYILHKNNNRYYSTKTLCKTLILHYIFIN
jgi:hypothetical protein